MTRRRAAWVLFGVFAFTVPLPILVVGPGLVPAVRLVMLGGLVAAVQLGVRSGGEALSLLLVFWGPAALYLAGLGLAAALVARLLARASPRAVGPATLAIAAVLVGVAASVPLYHTPFAAEGAHATLFEVLR